MIRAYSIKGEDVDAERVRVDQDLDQVDISRVVVLDELELRSLGPRDVRLKILAVSAEHNLAHAALADTVHISELRGGKIYPGNSALGEVVEVGGVGELGDLPRVRRVIRVKSVKWAKWLKWVIYAELPG